MDLIQAIANKFNIEVDYGREWIPINCPFHSDQHKSAAISFQYKQFSCMAGCDGLTLWKLAKSLELEYNVPPISNMNDEIEDSGIEVNNLVTFDNWINEIIPNKQRPIILRKQVEAYTNFLIERKIKPETIEDFGGYFESRETESDYGFLVIPYGTNQFIKRRILGTGERFRNTTGVDKNLFGRNIASSNSIILVEGITDFFTIWQYRETLNINPIASLGAKISKKQMYSLRNKKVFILFDSDYEGYIGARKAAEYLKEFNAIPIILEFPKEFISETSSKTDVNSAYCNFDQTFIDWLEGQINNYNSYDNSYVRSSFGNHNGNQRTLQQFSSGLSVVDSILSGGFASGIHGIAGRSGIGKSSLITELTCQAAKQDKKVLSLSYELSKEQMWSRVASRYSSFSWSEIEKDKSLIEDTTRTELNKISNLIKIELGWTIDQVLAAIDSFDVVIIDYIQRMEFEGNDPRKGIDINMGKLSNLARDKNKIIFIISSMAEGQDNFKESGSILYMCQSGSYLRKINHNVCSLEFIKNTRGLSGQKVYIEMNFAHQTVSETILDLEWIK